MLAALILVALCASGFAAHGNNDCAAQRQCGEKLSSLQPAYPLTTCSQDVKTKIQEVKACMTDIVTGKLACRPPGAPPGKHLVPLASVEVFKKAIEGLANSVCKGCPIVSALVECVTAKAHTFHSFNPCNETAFYAALAKVQQCIIGKVQPNFKECLAVHSHLSPAMMGVIEYLNVGRKQACKERERQATKRSLADSLKEYQDFLLMFK